MHTCVYVYGMCAYVCVCACMCMVACVYFYTMSHCVVNLLNLLNLLCLLNLLYLLNLVLFTVERMWRHHVHCLGCKRCGQLDNTSLVPGLVGVHFEALTTDAKPNCSSLMVRLVLSHVLIHYPTFSYLPPTLLLPSSYLPPTFLLPFSYLSAKGEP